MTFRQRLDRGRFNADENFLETRLHHQRAQFRIVGEIHGRLGEKTDAGARALTPFDQRVQQRFRPHFVADEIIVHDEHHVFPAAQPQRVQLGDQLRRRFGARRAAVHHDDVAKLAVKRAAARKLHGHGDVMAKLDEIPARHRRAREVGPMRGAINRLQLSTAHIGHHLRHQFFGFTEHEMLNFRKRLVAGGEQRPAGNHRFLKGRATCHNFAHRFLMHDHRTQQNKIGAAQVFVLELFHVQIHELEFPFRRQHGGHGQQAERGHGSFARNKADGMFETPKRVGRPGTDEQNFHVAM